MPSTNNELHVLLLAQPLFPKAALIPKSQPRGLLLLVPEALLCTTSRGQHCPKKTLVSKVAQLSWKTQNVLPPTAPCSQLRACLSCGCHCQHLASASAKPSIFLQRTAWAPFWSRRVSSRRSTARTPASPTTWSWPGAVQCTASPQSGLPVFRSPAKSDELVG